MRIENVTFTPDGAGIAALNQPGGLVYDGTVRAADATAQRVVNLILAYGLVDTGAMVGDVQSAVVEANTSEVVAQVGTPNVEYTRYQRQPFMLQALARLSPSDYEK